MPNPNRRSLLKTVAVAATAPVLPFRPAQADSRSHRLRPAAATAALAGAGYPRTAVWAYNGQVPGPVLRVRQGAKTRIAIDNGLPQHTTVHWHGVRLPFAMDGVPGLTQPAIPPGGRFVYEFAPPDAGTFWYHPHADSLRQIGRGLSGALIVEEAVPPDVDRDVLWVIGDWRLDRDARLVDDFGHPRDAAMAGRIGNTVTVNGTVSDAEPAHAGERIRLRLVNAAVARIVSLRFAPHRPVVVALDGQPCDPHQPPGDRVLLGPGMRADLIIDMTGDPGRRYPVVDDFVARTAYRLTDFAYAPSAARAAPVAALPRNPLPEPDLAAAETISLRLDGGMMGRRQHGIWAIDGHSMDADHDHAAEPLHTLRLGRSYRLVFRNDTAWWHPMHLHGHSFRLLSRDGEPVAHRQWLDSALIAPRERLEVAFVADNPGDWMLHCHVIDHQASGMSASLRVA
ncbi:MAG TPA: multicopper oxidase family protein [Burkholderiaceae bacterium]|nr:multicopper oxidase family protein [Burkholderiaceae bacterium]